MKVPLSWLKEFITVKQATFELAEMLTLIGLEVDSCDNDLLEISLTPNLAHCASILGVARELAALTDSSLHPPAFEVREKGESIHRQTSVEVFDPKGCPRYCCRLIRDVTVGPSPSWLKERIELSGMRSINNVVDATNYVMLELGQPLHAFDFDQLEEKKIIVRNAKKEEKLIALDGREYYFTEQDIVVADGHKPVAIAGVMGSADTEVSEKTGTILLESAFFNPVHIRRTSKRLGLRSEASFRFERGVDPNAVATALDRATALMCDLTGGLCQQGLIDIKQQEFKQPVITCRLSRINRLLGTHLGMSEIEVLFRRLLFVPTKTSEDEITVSIPTYRHDMHQEIDLIEEVARLYGYGNLKKREKPIYRTGTLNHSQEFLFERRARTYMLEEGLQEFLTCDLIGPAQAAIVSSDPFPSRTLIKLLNPHSIEQSIMRPSLLPGMISVVKYNADHSILTVAGFEIGRVHFTSKDQYLEPAALSIVLSGERAPQHWGHKPQEVDFFDLKGIVENVLDKLRITDYSFLPSTYKTFHPYRQAMILVGQAELGIVGQVHPYILKGIGIEQEVFFSELNLSDLLRYSKLPSKMAPLPLYPASIRDWTVTLDEAIAVGEVLNLIKKSGSQLLESVTLLDLYRSDTLGSNLKNATFRFVYRDNQKTISVAEVEKEHMRIVNNIDKEKP